MLPAVCVLQECQLGIPSSPVRYMSGLPQLSLEDSPQLSGSLPLVCSPAPKSEPCSKAAAHDTALDTAMWPDDGVSEDTLPGHSGFDAPFHSQHVAYLCSRHQLVCMPLLCSGALVPTVWLPAFRQAVT